MDKHKKTRLISYLGLGRRNPDGTYRYDPVEYFCPATDITSPETCYISHALAHLFKPDEIFILATDTASEHNQEGIEKAFRNDNLPAPEFVPLPDGKDPGELWKQFRIIKDLLKAKEPTEFILDITHGFRSQPFFASAAVAFIQSVQKEPIEIKVVYGAFEANESNRKPIWDLSPFVDLLSWSNSLMLFLKTGRVLDAVKIINSYADELERDGRGDEATLNALRETSVAIEDFGQDLVTMRTGSLLIGPGPDRPGSAERLRTAIERNRGIITDHLPPLADVLERIVKFAEGLPADTLEGGKGQKSMSRLAELYLEMERYPEAASIVREGRVTRQAGESSACAGWENFNNDDRYALERTWKTERIDNEIGDLRNDIEHGGFRKSPRSADEVVNEVKTYVDRFNNHGGA